jgi:hypothetical protein
MDYTVTIINRSGVHRAQLDNTGATLRLDGERDLHAYPDFQQLFFYGDYKRNLLEYCKLFRIQAAAL